MPWKRKNIKHIRCNAAIMRKADWLTPIGFSALKSFIKPTIRGDIGAKNLKLWGDASNSSPHTGILIRQMKGLPTGAEQGKLSVHCRI